MKINYWLGKVMEAYSLGLARGSAGEFGNILDQIHSDLREEFKHEYAADKGLNEIAEKIIIELEKI